MRIAIISDIHSNIVALEAALKDLQRQGDADHILVAGDMFAFGPAPNQVLAVLRELPRARFLLGNAERYLLNGAYPAGRNGNGWRDDLLLTFRWTVEELGQPGLDFLRAAPASQSLPLGERRLLAVHGSPRSDEENLTESAPPEFFAQMCLDPAVAIIACGHTHVPMDRRVGSLRVVNAGSVGIPFDGDPRASYALISVEAGAVRAARVEIRRVVYDIEQTVEQLYARGCPAADISAYNLRTGHSMGSSLIYPPEMRRSAPG
jgi:putative phosphoesterase